MAGDERATAKQWKTLGGFARQFGATSATALVASELGISERDIRKDGLKRGDASKVITALFRRKEM